jgi:hypothetical protein
MIKITIALFALAIISIGLVIRYYESLETDGVVYPLARAIVAVCGAGILFLGISFYTNSWPLAPFITPVLSILGVQISLWAVGIRSGLLGNAPLSLDTEIEQIDKPRHDDFHGYIDENMVSQMQLQLENSRTRSRFYKALLTHLIVAIGILDHVSNHHADISDEMQNAFRNEINEIMTLLSSPDNAFRDEDMTYLEPFIASSGIFRFGSLSAASMKLNVLTDFVNQLKNGPLNITKLS